MRGIIALVGALVVVVSVVAPVAGCIDLIHNDPAGGEQTRRILDEPGPGRKLDVALVLGCPADDDTGALSDCERCRVKSALRAYRDGEVDAVLMSGGAAHNRFAEAEVMGEAAVRRGLPANALVLEPRALTTWMNLRFAKQLMHEHGFRTALIITTAAHVPRARRFVDWYGIPARYRACDWDLPPDSDEEWSRPLRPGSK